MIFVSEENLEAAVMKSEEYLQKNWDWNYMTGI